MDEFKKTKGINLSKDMLVVQRLREVVEGDNIELSSTTLKYINPPFTTIDASCEKHLNIPLTRSKFEIIVKHLIKRIKRPCKDCMKAIGVTPLELDEVLLVGGMTRVLKA
jgi:molecular chaperone DnaK